MLELYGTPPAPTPATCGSGWSARRADFVEYDVEADRHARERMRALAGRQRPCRSWSRTDGGAGGLAGPRLHGGRVVADDARLLGPRARRGAGRRVPSLRRTAWRAPTRWPAGCSTATKASRFTSRASADARGRVPPELRARGAAGRDHRGDRGRGERRRADSRRSPSARAGAATSPPRASRPTWPCASAACASCSIPAIRGHGYPYINCTDCGPRYSIVLRPALRPRPHHDATPGRWTQPAPREYHDPDEPPLPRAAGGLPALRTAPTLLRHRDGDGGAGTRRSCRVPRALLRGRRASSRSRVSAAITWPATRGTPTAVGRAARAKVPEGEAVRADGAGPSQAARALVELSAGAEALLVGPARPIVLAPARVTLPGVAPDNDELGVMLPYAPLHHLLFAAGAPEVLVMTSANRSSEPIAYDDDDALERLAGLADALPRGRAADRAPGRGFGRRGAGPLGPVILRRGRGYAPGAVATLPTGRPVLALGADLKNTVTLVVDGQAFVSQHIGDLDALRGVSGPSRRPSHDLLAMYEVRRRRAARGARRPPAVPLHRLCRRLDAAQVVVGPAPSRARRVGARRAGRLGRAGARHELRRHRLRRRRHHLGRRDLRRQRPARDFERVAHLRRGGVGGRRCGRASSGAGRGGISRPARRASRSDGCAVRVPPHTTRPHAGCCAPAPGCSPRRRPGASSIPPRRWSASSAR